jgi:hypothetical protein
MKIRESDHREKRKGEKKKGEAGEKRGQQGN